MGLSQITENHNADSIFRIYFHDRTKSRSETATMGDQGMIPVRVQKPSKSVRYRMSVIQCAGRKHKVYAAFLQQGTIPQGRIPFKHIRNRSQHAHISTGLCGSRNLPSMYYF